MKKILKIIFMCFILFININVNTEAASVQLKNIAEGKLVIFGGKTWKVSNPADGTLVCLDPLEGRSFDTTSPYSFDPQDGTNIAYFLNNTFYNEFTAQDKTLIKDVDWEISNELGELVRTVNAKVGLLSIDEYVAGLNTLFVPYQYDGSLSQGSIIKRFWLSTIWSKASNEFYNVSSTADNVQHNFQSNHYGTVPVIKVIETTLFEYDTFSDVYYINSGGANKKINQLVVGDKIIFAGDVYAIVKPGEGKVVALYEHGHQLFTNSTAGFDISDNRYIKDWLNDDFYNNFNAAQKTYIKYGTWNIGGTWNGTTNPQGENGQQADMNICLLRLSEYHTLRSANVIPENEGYSSWYLITYQTNNKNSPYAIYPNSTGPRVVSPGLKLGVRPAFRLVETTDMKAINSNMYIVSIDETAPTVTFGTNGNATYSKTQSTTVTVTDSDSGVKTLQYAWSTSTATPGSGWTAFTSGNTISENAVNGNYYLHIKATDNADNVNNIHSNVFRLDNTNPGVPTLNMSETWTNVNRTFTVTGGSDSHSGVLKLQYKIGAGAWTDYVSTATALSATGTVTVYARTVDKVGLVSGQVSKIARVDKSLPADPSYAGCITGVSKTAVTLNWNAFSDGATTSGFNRVAVYAQKWNGSAWVNEVDIDGVAGYEYSSVYYDVNKRNITISGLLPGTKYRFISGRYYDNATNWGTYTWREVWTVPNTPAVPTGIVTGLSWHKTEGRGKVIVNWSAMPGATGYYIYVWDGGSYRVWNVGNVTSWDTSAAKIYPAEATITGYATDTRSVDIYNHSATGLDLRDDPSNLYRSSTIATYNASKNYWFRVAAYNSTGSSGYSGAYMPTLPNRTDITAPTVPTINMDETWTNVDRTFTLSGGSDAGSGVAKLQYKIGAGAWTDYSSTVTALSTTGTVTVYARTVDNVGLLSSEVSKIARVDKTIPTVPTLTYSDETNTSLTLNWPAVSDLHSGYDRTKIHAQKWNGSAWVNEVDIDGVAGYEYSKDYIDNSLVTHTVSSLVSGTKYRFYVRYYDVAGNMGNSGWIEKWTMPDDPTVVGTNGRVEWHKTAGRGYIKLDWASVTGATGYKLCVFDGYTYRYFDLGNVNQWDSRVFKIYPTEATINSNADNTRTANIFNTSGTGLDLRDNPNNLYVKASGTTYNTYTQYWTHIFAYNTSGNLPMSWGINHYGPTLVNSTDVTAPAVTFGTNGNAIYAKTQSTTVSVTDSESGVATREYVWSTSTVTPGSGFTSFSEGATLTQPTGTGDYYLHIKATDNVGNVLNTRSNVFKLDNQGPGQPTVNVNSSWSNTDESFTITNGADTHSSIDRSEYRLTGATTASWTTYTTLVVVSNEGTTTIEARTIDSLGNIGAIRTSTVNIDKTLPTGFFTPNSQLGWVNTDVAYTVNSSDDRSGIATNQIRYSLDNGATYTTWYNIATPVYNGSLSPSEGERMNQVKMIDNAGNEKIITSGVYNIDKTKPIASLSVSKLEESINANTVATDVLSGIATTPYRYSIKENTQPTAVGVYQGVSTKVFTGLKANLKYDVIVDILDNAGNVQTKVETVYTKAYDSKGQILNIESNEIVLVVTANERNEIMPDSKIVVTNVDDATNVIESTWSKETTRLLTGFINNGLYKVEIVTKNQNGEENDPVMILDDVTFITDTKPAEITEFAINYGENITYVNTVDLKLLAEDNRTKYNYLKVYFEYEGKEYGYDPDAKEWKQNYIGKYMKYYPAFDLKAGNYGNKEIVAIVVDEQNNKAKKVDEIVYDTVENVTPEIEKPEEPEKVKDDYSGNQVIYTRDGYIMTKVRLVRLKLRTRDVKQAQYSLDSINWSPWENVVSGYIDKWITLDGEENEVKTIYARTKNDYGVESQLEVTYYVLDDKAPEIKAKTTNNVNIAVGGAVGLRIEFDDNVSSKISYSISVSKGGAEEQNLTGIATDEVAIIENVTGLTEGFYNIMIIAEDELKNKSDTTINIWSK